MTIAKKTGRGQFQFTNATAQNAEAHLNLREAGALVERWVPAHLRETAPEERGGEAGAAFRRVTAICKRTVTK